MSGSVISQREGQPVLILTCQRDSHPFQERTIILSEVLKVGRSVARVKPASNNAIFDCKVLSRSHALIWYRGGRFWLRDTNSSNGTFVNSTRIVKRNDEEYADREIFSRDIIRFGVDVVEHDTTHGCIIAQVSLYLPNGVEANKGVEPISNNIATGISTITINSEQMFRLTHYIGEALFREQVLDNKLESIKQLLQETQDVSEAGWQAMVNQERLLEKLSLYETELSLLKQDLPENSLQSHLVQVLEEKFNLEQASKMMLERLLNEKTEVFSKATNLEHSLIDSQKECIRLRQNYESIQEAYQSLANERQSLLLTKQGSEKQLTEDKVEKSESKDNMQKVCNDIRRNYDGDALKDTNNDDDENVLVNGLDNGISKVIDNHDDKLNNDANQRLGAVDNIDQPEVLEADSFCESEVVEGSHNGPISDDEIHESIRLFSHSAQIIKSLQDELNILNKLRRSDLSTPSLPVKMESLKNKPDSLDSLIDTVVSTDRNTENPKYDLVNCCKDQSFETALQRATKYAALIGKFQDRVNVYLSSLSTSHNQPDTNNTDTVNSTTDTYAPTSALVTGNIIKKDASIETETYFDGPICSKVELNHLETSLLSKHSDAGEGKPEEGAEVSKLRAALMESSKEIEEYKQLTDDLRSQDAAKAELLSLVREECDALRSRISVIESDVATSRSDHHRLISEARRAQAEIDELLRERDKLSDQLNASNRQVEHLQGLLATTLLGEPKSSVDSDNTKAATPNETPSSNSTSQNIYAVNQCPTSSSPRTNHIQLYECCFSLFAVIPMMVLICAFMVYIFLQFVR
ncbi:unnamed protein product [Trichobilharzia szidati]|nr:unnamed protein product [Trichobilharzia szidati]